MLSDWTGLQPVVVYVFIFLNAGNRPARVFWFEVPPRRAGRLWPAVLNVGRNKISSTILFVF
jgi:hypothetical protein